MKTILVPCDFSPQSHAAYETALHIASRENGQVILLHVLYVPALYNASLAGEPLAFDPVYFTAMEEDARKELDKMMAQGHNFPVKVEAEAVFGDIVSSVKRLTETHHAELVVMGTTGASGFSEMFIGSNTEKVVRHASVPVLAIRQPVNVDTVKNILLPSILELDQPEFMRRVKELQAFFNATLHVLLINTPSHFRRDVEAREALEKFADHYDLKNYQTHFRNYWHEADGITDFTQREKMDLIAMGTHGLKGLAHMFQGSITEDVVNRIHVPVWTFALKNK